MIDSSIVNAYKLYDLMNRPQQSAHTTSQLDFRKNVINLLVKNEKGIAETTNVRILEHKLVSSS